MAAAPLKVHRNSRVTTGMAAGYFSPPLVQCCRVNPFFGLKLTFLENKNKCRYFHNDTDENNHAK